MSTRQWFPALALLASASLLAPAVAQEVDDPPGVYIYKPSQCQNGYTLLGPIAGGGPVLIDMQGNVIQEWTVDSRGRPLRGFPAKLLPNGDLLAQTARPDGGAGHLETGALVQVDWNGNVKWEFLAWEKDSFDNPIARQHHDFEREGNPVGYPAPGQLPKTDSGRTLILGHTNPPLAQTLHISQYPLEDDVFYEVDWNGNVLWQWRAWEHFEQMGFDAAARQAIQTVRVSNPQALGGGAETTDWLHVNSLSYVGPNRWCPDPAAKACDHRFHPDNLIWDARSANIIAIVARHPHPEGKWAEGDIVWRLGPDFSREPVGQIIGQHHAHVIPKGLPGEGNILLFDNGGAAGFGRLARGLAPTFPNKIRLYSRVVELNPVTRRKVWEYSWARPDARGHRFFFSYYISSAQRLGNGNTLITEGSSGRIFEITPGKSVCWEYISPFGWSAEGGVNDVYRAYRVPYDWVPD